MKDKLSLGGAHRLLACLAAAAPAAADGALELDGNDYVHVPLPAEVTLPAASLTVTAYVNVPSAGKPGAGEYHVIAAHCGGAGSLPWAFVLRQNAALAFLWQTPSGAWKEVANLGSEVVLLNKWSFVAVTFDSVAQEASFLWDTHETDGIGEQNANPISLASAATTAPPAFVATCGGVGHALLFGDGLEGSLDHVSVWNAVLSTGSVYASNAAPLSCSSAGLVGTWSLDEGSGTTASDAGPSGLDGQLGPAAAGADPAWGSPGSWSPGLASDCVAPGVIATAVHGLGAGGGRSTSPSYFAEASLDALGVASAGSSPNYQSLQGVASVQLAGSSTEPTLLAVLPSSGDKDGAESVRVIGSNFAAPGAGATDVRFAGSSATAVSVLSDTAIDATTPAGSNVHDNPLADVLVEVSNANGSSSLGDGYRYRPALTLEAPSVSGEKLVLGVHGPPGAFWFVGLGETVTGTALSIPGLEGALEVWLMFRSLDGSFSTPAAGSSTFTSTHDLPPLPAPVTLKLQAAELHSFAPFMGAFTNVLAITIEP